jgi:sirohydrochlorin cobaltochelatase
MSSTRSPFPTERPIKGNSGTQGGTEGEAVPLSDSLLIVVAHGTGSPMGDAALHHFVADLVERHIYADVRVAVLHGEPSLAEAAHGANAGAIHLLPFLMSGGVTFRKRLAEAMADVPWTETPLLYPPLGTSPGLAGLLAKRGEDGARDASWQVADSHLLLIGHGTLRDPGSAQTVREHQQRIAARKIFASVEIAFLDQPPHLPDVLASHAGPLLGVGLFAGEGQHGVRDMDLAFARAACPARYCGAIGGDKGLAAMALHHLAQQP